MNRLQRFIDDGAFRFLFICLGWACWWVLASTQNFFATIEESWDVFFERQADFASVGIIWALATPLVIYLAKLIRYDDKNIVRVFALHFLACLLILLLRTLAYTLVTRFHYLESESFVDNWLRIVGFQLLGNFVIYFLIVAVYYAIVWYLGFKDSELKALELQLNSANLERQLSEANLTALRMQLNPHFLFNTLHSVASLIRIKKNQDAIDTLSTLSELLRTTVYEGKANQVTIQEEISFIEKYLSIEQLRFSHRLEIVWDVEPDITDYKIPNLLLQPIVENALKHGLKETRHGRLSITIKKLMNHRIEFLVIDTGMGLPRDFDTITSANVGLKNTIHRLQGTYDAEYEFEISNNSGGPGVQVRLVIPAEI